uniref:Uncharacterized protein n=1 Tax=Lepeophtheirus salmonis TaxID=72036 RepID=A0A0K2UQG9_LEPSM
MTLNKASPSSHFTLTTAIMSDFIMSSILSMNVAINKALGFGVPSKLSFSSGVALM